MRRILTKAGMFCALMRCATAGKYPAALEIMRGNSFQVADKNDSPFTIGGHYIKCSPASEEDVEALNLAPSEKLYRHISQVDRMSDALQKGDSYIIYSGRQDIDHDPLVIGVKGFQGGSVKEEGINEEV